MSGRRPAELALVLAAVATLACSARHRPLGSTDGATTAPPASAAGTLRAEEREILYSGDSSHILYRSPARGPGVPSGFRDAVRIVVRDSSTWRAVWARLESPDARRAPPPVEPPAVDFTQDLVIVAAQGPGGSCSSGITIDTVYRVARTRIGVVVIRTREALGGCGCFAVARAPAVAVRVGRSQLEAIRFVERPPLDNCGHVEGPARPTPNDR